MRKWLDRMYDAAAWAAALFMMGCLAMVLAGVAERQLGFRLRGADAYAGYCMAAAGFLALAHTLKRGEHIRVTLLMDRLSERARRAFEIAAHAVGAFFSALLALYACRLVYQSYAFNDISQGNDATPLWIPQIGMAVGCVVLFVAVLDELVLHATRRHVAHAGGELKLME